MRLQTLLHDGPYDGKMVTIQSVERDWPAQIRVAARPGEGETMYEGKPRRAAVYTLVEASEMTAGVFFGSYRFSGMRESAPALITVWD